MSYEMLTCHKEENLAVVKISGAVDSQGKAVRLGDELSDLCSEIISDKEISVVVLTGAAQSAFAFEEKLLEGVSETGTGRPTRLPSIAEPIAGLDRPVISAIIGDAVGQGLELILACDMRIASDRSHFGFRHLKEALIPWDGGTQRLTRLVGKAKAMEMILTGEKIDAQEAYRIGLVNKVVPGSELMGLVMGVAREMASKGPIALRYAKESVNKGMDMTLEQGLRLEADLYFLLHTTRDRTEGIKAFQEKRKAKFEGK
jgi:enoyl-CoA hydratase/carnithine racemase